MEKLKFNLEDFKNKKIAVNCDTEEQAVNFLSYLERNNLKWSDDSLLSDESEWFFYEKNTCYMCDSSGVGFSYILYFKKEGYTILDYSILEFPIS